LDKLVNKSLVKDVIPVTEKESPHRFVIKLEDDSELKTRIVIIAIGNTSIPNVPPVFRPLYEKGLVKHIFKPFQEKCMNKRILVIGGGLSAAQLAILRVSI
jgi:thioredoxin reductase